MEIDSLKKSLIATCAVAVDWFLDHSDEITTDDWESDDFNDDELGAVFAFFDDDNDCLYVGSTEDGLKDTIEQRKLEEADWWDDWDTLELLNIQDETDMKALEMLLIFGLEPDNSEELEGRDPDDMFVQFDDN